MTHHNRCLMYASGQSPPQEAEGEQRVSEQFQLNRVFSTLNHPSIYSSGCRATPCAPTCLYGLRTLLFVCVFFLLSSMGTGPL